MLELPDWVPKKTVTVDTLTRRYFELFPEFKDVFVRYALKVATASVQETPDAARKLATLVHLQGVNDSLKHADKLIDILVRKFFAIRLNKVNRDFVASAKKALVRQRNNTVVKVMGC